MQQLSVSELIAQLNRLVAREFPERIRVSGEVVGLSRPGSGHIYFTLMEADAKIRCVYFRGNILKSAFIPKDGDKVEVDGEARVYPQDGSFQIIVRQIRYNAEGEYWKAFALLCKKLEGEGLFDASRKKEIRKYPERIALLTAENGAAITDFLVTAKAKRLFFNIDIYPIPVQGAENAPLIAKAIAKVSSQAVRYDALVLTRGGGALEDLSVFNDERVVRALAASNVPTVSAIGHERDITICDFAADIRVATPTAAAELLTKEYAAAIVLLEKYYMDFTKSLIKRVEIANITFDNFVAKLYSGAVAKRAERYCFLLEASYRRITTGLREFIVEKDKEFSLLSGRLIAIAPNNRLPVMKAAVDALQSRLINAAHLRFKELSFALASFEERLRLADPDRLLAAGYSMIYKDGVVISSVSDLNSGDAISVRVLDGAADARIESIHNNILGERR
ncbi:MAG: exodeoxyribonuclease VII large subunit [Deferribacteraceae bacterium]|jgi:exodeoxyribonuclease VII large subunit|nr:exodeoxyribonuclease VII large subunit [Deferribacteraceae bacterium]